MSGYGIGASGPVELMAQWQSTIKENGYLLDVRPSIHDIKNRVLEPHRFWGGRIIIGGKAFPICFYPSSPTHSENNPIRGKPCLYIQYGGFFKKTRLANKALAEKVISIFEKKGATRFEPKDLW
jgi:hypothetical protein